ncbi:MULTISPECIES: aldehyde ferredoxin oxidoreductase N-terminal domain-containing protein [Anaerolinea]|uniref:Glyceraldehyde-3-phosphate: ferredoxin oxidoreductase n=1 Tax=Anaerolinea thermophila (strain DSM 14523 / JCM 11388 / NBRC 100420 / UNI-1) TaxID=926569 RepID=E8N4Z8_ANATU|nr:MULTISPECIES: aldehyde ferredoxin oxidoreductase N-terminal domain-containing protein [Anaerolinea]BAJ63512.1 putative glyceraldehyde-3-phosphate: ferredoxin oxidoreductase [Anaerolinea thermophila UNI-1]
MTYPLMLRELVIHLDTGEYEINRIEDPRIIGPVDYGWSKYHSHLHMTGQRDPALFTFGGGPLAGSRIPGTRRLVFCSYSPLWDGFYISSMGGAAYILHRVGVDFVCLKGEAKQDSVLILNHKDGQVTARLESINPDVLWNGYVNPQGEWLTGFYALQQAVFDRYKDEYEGDWVRVFAVGPGARYTNQGIIGSNPVRRGILTPIEDWAGRGGLGSRLLQCHRIAACIFGGDWVDPDLQDSKEIDAYFMTYYQQSMIKTDLGATEKYRYVPDFQTGGTFGVNMLTVEEKLLSFNYRSIYQAPEERLKQHKEFILNHYLKQFNEEIIQPKQFDHCGEPCSVVCKKYTGKYKKDYEPYQALGPLCGVFDQRAAEELNHFVDSLGLDAIQIGSTVSWIMECVAEGLIRPEDFNLPSASELSFHFANDPIKFQIVEDSLKNARYAREIINMLMDKDKGKVFQSGIRAAAYALDERYGYTQPGKRTIDRAVFTSHGRLGCMTINQYWVPGMLSPMPMMGKYFVYYGVEYLSPRELGRKCVHRMVYEFFSENSGVCRFHRKWVEAIVDEIITAHYDLGIDYTKHQFNLCKDIHDHESPSVVFWESERNIDLIWKFLEDWKLRGLNDASLEDWLNRFQQDKYRAARQFWDEIREGIEEAFEAGADSIPEIAPPYKAAKLDIMEQKN